MLRAELHRLRWWSFALWSGALRQVEVHRKRRTFTAWRTLVRIDNAASVRHPPTTKRTREAAVVAFLRPLDNVKPSPASATALARTRADTTGLESKKAMLDQRRRAACVARRERISQAAWSGLAHQLAVFVAWASAVLRAAAFREAASTLRPCEIELLLCAFSAWLVQISKHTCFAYRSTGRSTPE